MYKSVFIFMYVCVVLVAWYYFSLRDLLYYGQCSDEHCSPHPQKVTRIPVL